MAYLRTSGSSKFSVLGFSSELEAGMTCPLKPRDLPKRTYIATVPSIAMKALAYLQEHNSAMVPYLLPSMYRQDLELTNENKPGCYRSLSRADPC